MDFLIEWDRAGLLAVNGMYDAFQDALWWMVSAKWSSLLLLLALLWVLMHQNRRHALLFVAMLALAFLVADQVASGLIKGLVERLRPTHDPSLGSLVACYGFAFHMGVTAVLQPRVSRRALSRRHPRWHSCRPPRRMARVDADVLD